MLEVKYLNQEIKRKSNTIAIKDAIIIQLKKKLRKSKQRQSCGTDNLYTFDKLKRTHKRLKDSYKAKRLGEKDSIPLKHHIQQLRDKDEIIRFLDSKKMVLEEMVQELSSAQKEKRMKENGKTYSPDMRIMVYDAIVNQVPTQNIPLLIQSHANRTGENLDSIPHRTTVEQIARELGIIADLQTSEMAMKTKDLTRI